jgi:hypothetical protein
MPWCSAEDARHGRRSDGALVIFLFFFFFLRAALINTFFSLGVCLSPCHAPLQRRWRSRFGKSRWVRRDESMFVFVAKTHLNKASSCSASVCSTLFSL